MMFNILLPERVEPSIQMSSLPSNHDTNTIDALGGSPDIPVAHRHMTVIEVPLILQEESSDTIVRPYKRWFSILHLFSEF